MKDDRQTAVELLFSNFNSEVTGPMFTKFLHDVDALLPLLMRSKVIK